jgi:hypothetical protein
VDQSSGDVKHREAANPCNQQNNEQYCPNAHFSSPRLEVPSPSRTVLLRVNSQAVMPVAQFITILAPAPAVINANLVAVGKSICTWKQANSHKLQDLHYFVTTCTV